MSQKNNQSTLNNGEINITEVFKKLLKAKFTIILIALIVTISVFINNKQKIPLYNSTMLIEVGQDFKIDDTARSKLLIENPTDLFSEYIKASTIRNELELPTKVNLYNIENSIIKAQTSSNSFEENTLSLNLTLEFILSRHDKILKDKIQKNQDKLITEINNTIIQIEFREKYLNNKALVRKSNLNIEISNLNNHIKELKKVIGEDEDNFEILQATEELKTQAALKNTTLNQVIYGYKEDLLEYNYLKKKKQTELKSLEKTDLDITLFELSQKKKQLNESLDKLNNSVTSKTKLISIDTEKIIQSPFHNIFLAFFVGLFLGSAIVLLNNYIRSLINEVNT